ncbi:hypothetical protein ScPMuIL_003145 [Solemya velum]
MSGQTTNLAAVVHGPNDLRMEEIAVPVPGEGGKTGVHKCCCRSGRWGSAGSDIKYWRDGRCGRFRLTSPMVIGHEASGTVVGVGPGVLHLKLGDRVAIEPGVPCRKCQYCKSGRYNLCPDIVFCATPPGDGNMCRYYIHPADFCFRLPDCVSLDEGALLEPLAVAIHSCRKGDVTSGDSVLVCGAGPIGILTMLVARRLGAEKIVITDVDIQRLEFAASLGASTLLVQSQTQIELCTGITDLLQGRPRSVFECSGVDTNLHLAIDVVAPGGVVVMVGRGSSDLKLPVFQITSKEVQIKGVFRYSNCYRAALNMVLSMPDTNIKQLITHRFPLEGAIKAFEMASGRNNGAIKVVVQCDAITD